MKNILTIGQGTAQIKASYDHVFSTIKPEIKFDIEEVVVSGDYAFAKTLSRGKATVLESNITQPEENRELFIFRKDAGEWKIARYMFNKSKPSSKQWIELIEGVLSLTKQKLFLVVGGKNKIDMEAKIAARQLGDAFVALAQGTRNGEFVPVDSPEGLNAFLETERIK